MGSLSNAVTLDISDNTFSGCLPASLQARRMRVVHAVLHLSRAGQFHIQSPVKHRIRMS